MSESIDVRSGVDLTRRLGIRLAVMSALVVFLTTVSAPLAFFVLGRGAVRVQARATAEQVAQLMERHARERPRLWRYDTLKILQHLRSYEVLDDIVQIEIVDRRGRRLEGGRLPASHEPVVWARAPLHLHHETIGEVWVAGALSGVERSTTMLLGGFGIIGALLGGLLYLLPIRTLVDAETEITRLVGSLRASRSELAELAEGLEREVERRASELQQAYSKLRDLSAKAVQLQEGERRGIARDLHDSAGQTLTAIRLHLQVMEERLETVPEDAPRLREAIVRTVTLVDETVEEIRRAVDRLGPAVLDDIGLASAIQRAVDDASEAAGVDAKVEIDVPNDLDASLEVTCYRIVQECLTNVVRHADARGVEVRVHAAPTELRLEVADDGVGFEPRAVSELRRGLSGMRERVELLGGEWCLEARPGHGTRVEIVLPRGPLDAA